MTPSDLSTASLALVFAVCAGVIAVAGTRMAGVAEAIAHRTGLGQALVGAVLVGVSTSLAGSVLSVNAAATGHPSLAISNAVGGIVAQTAFLALADLLLRDANLEHAAASVENLAQGALLVCLLALVLVGVSMPEVTLFGVNPVSPLLVIAWLAGLRLVRAISTEPMWIPIRTAATQEEPTARPEGGRATPRLFLGFLGLAAVMGLTGWALSQVAGELSGRTGLDESLVGGLFTSVTTSLPELITVIAAVRRGALNLAVGDIVGGNTFDVLFVAVADVFYREGSIYHAISSRERFLTALGVVLAATVVMGLARREPRGPANIGFESIAVLVLYVAGFLVTGLAL